MSRNAPPKELLGERCVTSKKRLRGRLMGIEPCCKGGRRLSSLQNACFLLLQWNCGHPSLHYWQLCLRFTFLQMKNLYQFITSTSYLEDAGLVLPNINANSCFPNQVSNYLILFILHSEQPYCKFEYGN